VTKEQEMSKNSLKKIRESLFMSKAELAIKAKISSNTITRIERGMPCRIETKRKIMLALRNKISNKNKIFGEDIAFFIKDNEGRRLGIDRRNFSYDMYIPEHRSGNERRSGLDRRLQPRTSDLKSASIVIENGYI
jgi:DNA-binding XRE family transcriptional regulator